MSLRVDLGEGARIALGSIATNRLRAVLTTLGISIGVAALLAIVGIIQGLNQSFAEQLSTIGSSTLYVAKFPWMTAGDWWIYRNRKELNLSVVSAIKAQSTHAVAVAPSIGRSTSVAFMGHEISMVRVVGTTTEYLATSGFSLTSGRPLSDADDASGSAVVLIGSDVAEALFPHGSPLHASVRIDGRPYRVVGTLSHKGKILGESQDRLVIVPFRTFQAMHGKRRNLTIAVAVATPDLMDAAQDQLVGIVRRARATPPDKPDDFTINRPEQLAETYRQLTSALYGVAVGIGLITLLVGGIGIMNIMLVSVRERTREIGIRRALGARRRTIVLQFLIESAALSSLGGALGTFTGLLAAKVLSEITPLAAAVELRTVVFGVSFAGVVGLLFGIWPAARAAQLDPVEALRYE